MKQKGENIKLSFALCRGEMKEENLDALRTILDILKAELDTYYFYELNLSNSIV